MRPIGIRHHRERFVVFDQLVDEQLKRLIVTIVVTGSMNDQQIPFEEFR